MVDNIDDGLLIETKSELNLTPMIDVVFILLIFFVLSSANFLRSAMPVDSLQSSQAQAVQKQVLDVFLDASGTMTFKDKTLSPLELKRSLAHEIKLTPEAVVIIHPHRNVRAQDLMRAMDVSKAAKARNISIGAKRQ